MYLDRAALNWQKTKKCATCQQDKPLTAYSTRTNGSGGTSLKSSCRDCVNADQRADTEQNARRNARRRARRAELAATRSKTPIDARETVPDYKLREEWTHFRACGISNQAIAQRLGYAQVESMYKSLNSIGIDPLAPTQQDAFKQILAALRAAESQDATARATRSQVTRMLAATRRHVIREEAA